MMKQGSLSGQTLGGKYLLGELLGKGGFGAVYKAENRMLRRQQAVKVLLEEHFSEEKFRDRFLREAQTLAALDHANIVHVDDIGIEGNLIYLVMPYISGGTLQDILKARSGPLALEVAARYLEQVCLALGYAHAQGIAHLDLKPLNLLVHQDGRLLLSDFGLAHLMERGAIEGGTSLQFGSPLYMAPEHFEGQPTQRSDLYALGVILYQMLTGRHPFEASTPAAVMRKHLTEPPPPLHLARPDLPVALDAVIGKALAKQQEQRYERAGELLFDFRAALGGQALRFASSAEQTRLSQAALDPTLRAVNPPASSAGPTLAGMGPAVPPPISQPMASPLSMSQPIPPPPPPPGYYGSRVSRPPSAPVPSFAVPAPQKGQIWTPGFTRLFVLTAIAGGVAVVLNLINVHFDFPYYHFYYPLTLVYRGPVLITWIAQAVLAAICWLGWRFSSSRAIRAGFLLQFSSVIGGMLYITPYALNVYIDWIPFGLVIALVVIMIVLSALSLVCISYGLARWLSSQDGKVVVLQILLGLGGAVATYIHDAGGNGIVPIILLACWFLAGVTLLVRASCWKQYPVITACLVVGWILFVTLRDPFYYFFGSYNLLFFFPALPYIPFILGFLLLVQTERARKRVQQAQPAQAMVGQRLP